MLVDDVREGTIVCVACAHVDDMVFGVHPSSPLALQAAWKWRSWEVNGFVQAGILITQLADGNIIQSFPRTQKPKDRRLDDGLSPAGKTACQ